MRDKKIDEYFVTNDQLMEKFKICMAEYKLDRNPETKSRALKVMDDLRDNHTRISKRLHELMEANKRVGGSNVKRKIG